jgi:hypothetical protein
VTPARVRIAAGIFATAAVALAGCGGEARPVPSAANLAPAYDPQRVEDFVPLTTARAARTARRIALVVSRGSRVVPAAGGTPFTRTTFAVERILKGRLPRRFVLQVIGGRIGNSVVTSPVQPFTRSARYILFLGPDGPAGPTIMPQSILAVTPAGAVRLGDARTGLDDALSRIRRYAR